MKIPFGKIILGIAVASSVQGANVSGLDVTIKKSGKAVYQGKTDARGSFSTGSLEAGAYNVEFRAPKSMSLSGQSLSISVLAGKNAARMSSAEGKHMQGGVALNVEVPKPSKLTGQVTSGRAVASAGSGPVPVGMERVKANVKVINGKRHVWVPAPIGSNMGGKWVEEGTEGAALSTSNKKGDDRQVLQHIQDQSANVGRRGQ